MRADEVGQQTASGISPMGVPATPAWPEDNFTPVKKNADDQVFDPYFLKRRRTFLGDEINRFSHDGYHTSTPF
jgi:hypothetical protein